MFRKVVVGTDGSARAGKAVQEAIDLAKSEGASLYVVTAFGRHETLWEEIESSARVSMVDMRRVAEGVVAREGEKAQEQGVEVDWGASEGDPAEVICQAAVDEDADLIVIGNKGMSGGKRFLMGSVPNKVSHHAPCSVMVVRTD